MKSLEPFLENLTRLISLRQSTSLSVIVQDYLSETGTTKTTVGFDPDFFLPWMKKVERSRTLLHGCYEYNWEFARLCSDPLPQDVLSEQKGFETGTGVRTVGLGSQLTKGLSQCIEWVTRTKTRYVKRRHRRLVKWERPLKTVIRVSELVPNLTQNPYCSLGLKYCRRYSKTSEINECF